MHFRHRMSAHPMSSQAKNTNMLKLKIFLFLIAFTVIQVSAQRLTEGEKAVFDEIVYKRRKVGEYEQLSKWVIPVRYKIYGDTSAYLVKEVDSFFELLKSLTSLDIQKASSGIEENFVIVFAKKPEDFQPYTITNKSLESPGLYRHKTNNRWEIYWGQSLINTDKMGGRSNAKVAIKKSVIKSFGFIKDSELAKNSIFYSRNYNMLKVDDFDSHIISTLYLPAVKPGMTRDQVDEILKLLGK